LKFSEAGILKSILKCIYFFPQINFKWPLNISVWSTSSSLTHTNTSTHTHCIPQPVMTSVKISAQECILFILTLTKYQISPARHEGWRH